MKNNFFAKLLNKELDMNFSSNEVLFVEKDSTKLERKFSKNIKTLFEDNSINVLRENDIRQYLNWKEIINILWLFFLLNCQLVYQLGYNALINVINYMFDVNLFKYNIYLKFPVLYPCWDKKYLVPNTTAILHVGAAPDDFLCKLYKIRKTIMINEISDDDLLNEDSTFQHHFNLNNICKGFMCWIGISKSKKFRIYSINGCSQIYSWNDLSSVESDILCKFFLKPTVPKHDDFDTFVDKNMNASIAKIDTKYFSNVSNVLTEQGLLPIKKKLGYMGCNIKSYTVQKFLCNRNGMSYGFMAYQKITKMGEITKISKSKFVKNGFKNHGFKKSLFYFTYNDEYYTLRLPVVRVVSTRSGCDKSNINPKLDLLLYEIKNLNIRQVTGTDKNNFQPSFDIWIILTQALCNAIICNILYHMNPDNNYVNKIMKDGIMLVHIHAFPDKNKLSNGCLVFGSKNPSISCGCAESSYYCFHDQLDKFIDNLDFYMNNYSGSLFLEKDHGIVLAKNYSSDKKELREVFESYLYGEKNFQTFM